MLSLEKEWIKEGKVESKEIEYRKMDFYGPFLTLKLKKYENGTIEVIPMYSIVETSEVFENHFLLLSKATQELYNEIGEFVLKTKLFSVKIDYQETEKILLEKLKNIKLF